jgi:hypothetical protein
MGMDRLLWMIDNSLANESEDANLGETLDGNLREYRDVFG